MAKKVRRSIRKRRVHRRKGRGVLKRNGKKILKAAATTAAVLVPLGLAAAVGSRSVPNSMLQGRF